MMDNFCIDELTLNASTSPTTSAAGGKSSDLIYAALRRPNAAAATAIACHINVTAPLCEQALELRAADEVSCHALVMCPQQ